MTLSRRMATKLLGANFVVLLGGCSQKGRQAPSTAPDATPQPSQKPAAAKEAVYRIQASIHQDCGAEVGGLLPVRQDISRLCALVDWPMSLSGEPSDAVFRTALFARGIGASYVGGPERNWTGAHVRGSIQVERPEVATFRRDFVCHTPPPSTIGANYPDTAFGPCHGAYVESFYPAFMDALAAMFGAHPLTVACGDETFRVEAKAALLRMGKSALPALARAQATLAASNKPSSSPSTLAGILNEQLLRDYVEISAKIRLGAAIDYMALAQAVKSGREHLLSEAALFATAQSGCQQLTADSLLTPDEREKKREGWILANDIRLALQDIRDPRMVPFIIQIARSDPSSLHAPNRNGTNADGLFEFCQIARDMRDTRFVDPLIEICRASSDEHHKAQYPAGTYGDNQIFASDALEAITGQDMGDKFADAGAWADWRKTHVTPQS